MSELAIQVDIAETLLEAVSKAETGLSFTAERNYVDWEMPLKKETPLRIDISPVSKVESELITYGTIRLEPRTDLVIRRKFDGDSSDEETGRIDKPEIDRLVLFVQTLFLFLVKKRMAEGDKAAWFKEELVASYMPSHIREHRQFTGIIRITHAAHFEVGC